MNPGVPPFVALWCDGAQRLHLLTSERHLPDQPLADDIVACTAVERFLPQLTGITPRTEAGRWLLLLEPSLPPAWQALPWERLTLGGQPLARQALVVRQSRWGQAKEGLVRSLSPSRYLNLFPSTGYPFAEKLQPAVAGGQLRRTVAQYLVQEGAGSSDLFILAHGNAQGLLDAQGRPLELPAWHPMPERIWLLACNVDGAMNRLATVLLDRGCRTVVAATGELSALQMDILLNAWAARSHPQIDPAAWLSSRSAEQGDGGVQALTVWGALLVDSGATAGWNRLAWEIRHESRDALPLDESIEESGFHAAFEAMQAASTWRLAREEMAPPLLWLAEKFHHPALGNLEREVENLLGTSPSPAVFYALAASARRLGHYPAMARYLVRSLGIADQSVTAQADGLGQLANLFIDLDLPGAALDAIAQHQDLDIDERKARRSAEFRRLDWLARAEMRRGRYEVALTHMRTKRRRAIEDEKYDGSRELAGLLYMGAWGCRAGTLERDAIEPLAQEALQQVVVTDPAAIGAGNADEKYLMRGLAAWAWVANDPVLLDQVTAWRNLAFERLAEHDPGPWAYVLIFLHLAGRAAKPDFECALEILVRAGYLLEAALFASLGAHPPTNDWLRRFRQRREEVLAKLVAKECSHGNAVEESGQRAVLERSVLGDAHQMASKGALPL